MTNARLVRAVAIWATTLLAVAVPLGCSSGPAVGTITGEVTYDGQPVQKGYVTFTPSDGQSQTGGAEIVDGKFRAERVPVTKMKVELHGVKKTGKKIKAYDTPDSPVSDEEVELLPPKYNFNSDITLDVKPGTQHVKYDLKK
jgi:hypothetical protein